MPHPVKPSIKTEIIPLLIIIIVVSLSFYFYSKFPDQVPTHWNFQGEVDDYSSRAVGAFLFPGIIVGMYLLFMILPYSDPKRNRYEQFAKVYHIFKAYIMLFMLAMYVLTGLSALGYKVNIGAWVSLLVGGLFILIGNYLSKVKPNWFLGIRTPWTLSSEEVWNKTHRIGGKLFILGGIIIAFVPYLGNKLGPIILIADIIIISLGSVLYSYLLFRKEQRKAK